jgi:hypothetical protein
VHVKALNSLVCGIAVRLQIAPRRAEKDFHRV